MAEENRFPVFITDCLPGSKRKRREQGQRKVEKALIKAKSRKNEQHVGESLPPTPPQFGVERRLRNNSTNCYYSPIWGAGALFNELPAPCRGLSGERRKFNDRPGSCNNCRNCHGQKGEHRPPEATFLRSRFLPSLGMTKSEGLAIALPRVPYWFSTIIRYCFNKIITAKGAETPANRTFLPLRGFQRGERAGAYLISLIKQMVINSFHHIRAMVSCNGIARYAPVLHRFL